MKRQTFLPDEYHPAEDEPFMNDRQLEYFRRKLLAWKQELLDQSAETLEVLQDSGRNVPDIADRASEETDRAIELRTRDRQRKLVSKIDAALRRIDEGGSWLVRVALARTGLWLRDMGRGPDGLAAPDISFAQAADRLATVPSAFGTLLAVRHAAEMSETPAQWALPSAPFGTHPPRW